MIPFDRRAAALLEDIGGYSLPDAAGVLETVVIRMRRDNKGRSAGREPAIIPIHSSVKDQRPILDVPYMNSAGLL